MRRLMKGHSLSEICNRGKSIETVNSVVSEVRGSDIFEKFETVENIPNPSSQFHGADH